LPSQDKICFIESSPVVNFFNILHTIFLYESLFGSFFFLHVTREKLPKRCSYKKFARKMLMKLTPVVNVFCKGFEHNWKKEKSQLFCRTFFSNIFRWKRWKLKHVTCPQILWNVFWCQSYKICHNLKKISFSSEILGGALRTSISNSKQKA